MKTIRLISMIVLAGWIYGCSEKAELSAEPPAHTPLPAPIEPSQPPSPAPAAPVTTEPKIMMYKMSEAEKTNKLAGRGAMPDTQMAGAGNTVLPPAKPVYKYAARVQAPRTIKKNLDPSVESAGQLLVWVGQPGFEPPAQLNMNAQSGILPQTGTEAISARITPEFPDNPLAFEVQPKESECQKVEPQGTEVSFKLIPKILGEFRVGASVRLYGEKGCQGDIITRTAEPITVKVIVGISPDSIYQEIWTAFMKFFKEILTIFTALLIFLFRNKLKKLFLPDKTP